MKHSDEKAGHQISCQSTHRHQENTNRAIPLFYISDRFGGMGFLNDIHDVGTANGLAAQCKQHRYNIERKAERKKIRLGIKCQRHFLRVHQKDAEHLPHKPGQRTTQNSPGHTGTKG